MRSRTAPRRAEREPLPVVRDLFAVVRGVRVRARFVARGHRQIDAAPDAQPPQVDRRGQLFGFLGRLRRDRRDAQEHARLGSRADGRKCRRYMRVTGAASPLMKCANANGRPSLRGERGAVVGRPEQPHLGRRSRRSASRSASRTDARRAACRRGSRRRPALGAESAAISRDSSASETRCEPPGARPMPRSMRPGASASSMRNCSATLSAV